MRTDTLIDLVLDQEDPPASLIRASGFVSEDDLLDAVSSDDSDKGDKPTKRDTAGKSDAAGKNDKGEADGSLDDGGDGGDGGGGGGKASKADEASKTDNGTRSEAWANVAATESPAAGKESGKNHLRGNLGRVGGGEGRLFPRRW